MLIFFLTQHKITARHDPFVCTVALDAQLRGNTGRSDSEGCREALHSFRPVISADVQLSHSNPLSISLHAFVLCLHPTGCEQHPAHSYMEKEAQSVAETI